MIMPLLSVFYLISVLPPVVVQSTDVITIFVYYDVLAFLQIFVLVLLRFSALM